MADGALGPLLARPGVLLVSGAVVGAWLAAFEEIRRRLMACGAADDFVTDFGPVLSWFFVDPDGLEGEVVVANPDAEPGVFHPPGTRAACYPAS